MVVVWTFPLVFSVALVVPLAVERVHRPTRLLISRIALSLFGEYVANDTPRKRNQQSKLRAAQVATTHRVYAVRTLLYSLVFGVSGSIIGVYLAAVTLSMLEISGEMMRAQLPPALAFLATLTRVTQLGPLALIVLLLTSSATIGAALAFGTYYARWELLDQRARSRASEIEATLPRTIAFIYALSRSGMAFPAILDTLTQNERVYGEAASEIGVAVRDMNTFGTDVLNALDRMAQRTPSESLDEFGANLASVLGSGQSLSVFLKDQHDRYQEQAESQQRQYLELLATFAEAYVTVLVAGPLFLITILVVIGLVLADTLPLLRLVVYVGVPLASAAFILYTDYVTRKVGGSITAGDSDIPTVSIDGITDDEVARSDGGEALKPAPTAVDSERRRVSRERLAIYRRLERALVWLRQPGRLIRRNPIYSFAITGPIALWWLLARVGTVPLDLLAALRVLGGPLVEVTLFTVGVFALIHELKKRRIREIEQAVPDFLDRLASINDAGVSVVNSLERLSHSDLDALTPEVERTWRDVQWGADVRRAFLRMDQRIASPMVSRATALITNAMAVSGQIGPVLEIAADEARAGERLRRERRQEMLTYLMVIYISFLVFIGIVVALSSSFIPAIDSAELGSTGQLPGGVSSGLFSGIANVNTNAYELIFFHAAIIQSVFSGIVAGQLGEGAIEDGAKHVVVLLTATMIAFVFI
ncbi:MAG: type II secretion system F family protein [Halolamina sp.]|uniref:type II secretion system F family protein n=1 Tax=Halolamina sp. TaxID=1940283 RepID=UPI002FC2BDD0